MNRGEEQAIEWECQRILIQLCQFNDTRKFDELANLFTPDGVWIRLGEALIGREKIYQKMEERAAGALVHQVLSNVLITVIDADHADAISYKSIYRHEAGETLDKPVELNGPKWVSVYNEKLERTEEGWRIARKEGVTLFERDPVP